MASNILIFLYFPLPLFINLIIFYYNKKRLKIPKGQSESVYRRRTDNPMAKRKSTKGQEHNIDPIDRL